MTLADRFAHLRPHLFTSHRDKTLRFFALHDMPYPLDCAVLGHKPIWATAGKHGWIECSRCTLRPTYLREVAEYTNIADEVDRFNRAHRDGYVTWLPRRAESHLEVSRSFTDALDFQVRIGTAASETPLDAHLIIPKWRGFYFGTSVLGRRLALRRTRNAKHGREYKSSTYGIRIDADRIHIQLGAPTGEWSRDQPRWWDWSWSWRDALLGRRTCDVVKGDPVDVFISMPEGDYPATAWRETRTWRRPRFVKPTTSESVSFRIDGGIPNGRHKWGDWDGTVEFGISLDNARTHDGWTFWAPRIGAARLIQDRTRYASPDWTPPADALNPLMVAR